MSKDCDIVKDLLVNYKENALRENTILFVENHLKECDECTEYLKIVEEEFSEEKNNEINNKEINFFKKINQKIKSKRKIIKVLMFCLSIIIIFNIGIFINYNTFMNKVSMEVFLKDNIDKENKDKIESCIKEFDVQEYAFKSKEESLEQMKERLGDDAYMLNGYNDENNIFPESYIITAEKNVIEKLSEILGEYNGVKKIVTQINYNPYEIFILTVIKK